MNRFLLRNLLDELHDAAVASQARGQTELFAIEAGLATAGKPAVIVGRAIARHQDLEVIKFTASRNANSAVCKLMRLESLPLNVVTGARLCHVVGRTAFDSAAWALVGETTVV